MTNSDHGSIRATTGGHDPMHPIETRVHVDYHLSLMRDEARRERLASSHRRRHMDEHAAHAELDHRHAPAGGVRGAVGRLLIGLGTAIAGSAGPEAGAGRPA